MSEEQDHQKLAQNRSPKPPKWPQLLLAINLALLIGLVVWLLGDPSLKSGDELKKTVESKESEIIKAMDKNPAPVDFTGKLGGVIELVINATDMNDWIHFSFAKGTSFKSMAIMENSIDWDIAFRRAKIVTNGGDTSRSGDVEVAVLPTKDFGSVLSAPAEGYIADARLDNGMEIKSRHELEKWYQYDFWTHHLKSKELIYILKTADGHYAKFQILSYYCGKVAGCYTIRYQYRGSDGLSFVE